MTCISLLKRQKARAFQISVAFCCILISSCSTFKKTSDFGKSSLAKIVPSRLPIATVKESSLLSIPTGTERALAYEKKIEARRFAALRLFKPRSYNAPQHPENIESLNDSGLLPSLGE